MAAHHLKLLPSRYPIYNTHKDDRRAKSAKWEPRGKQGMLVGYDGHTIYCVYLPDKEKIIRIKDLKIVENVDGKADSHVVFYDAIAASRDDTIPPSSFNTPQPIQSNLITPPLSNTQTRSGRVTKLPKRYDAGTSNNVQNTPISAN